MFHKACLCGLIVLLLSSARLLRAEQFDFRDENNLTLGTIEDDGTLTISSSVVVAATVTAVGFIGDGSQLTGLVQPGIITVSESTSTNNIIDINSLSFVQIATLTVTLDGDRRILGSASVTVNNGGNTTSEYTLRIIRSTVAVSSEYIHSIPKAIINTVSIVFEESPSPINEQKYVMEIKSDNIVGGSNFQRVEATGMLLQEY